MTLKEKNGFAGLPAWERIPIMGVQLCRKLDLSINKPQNASKCIGMILLTGKA
jgi:hypothetical protein